MNTPRNGRRREGQPREASGRDGAAGNALEQCSCGLAGLLTTVAVVVLFYQTLAGVAREHLLASTGLAVGLAALWVLTWLGLELVWEWRAGRLATDA